MTWLYTTVVGAYVQMDAHPSLKQRGQNLFDETKNPLEYEIPNANLAKTFLYCRRGGSTGLGIRNNRVTVTDARS
jgi:hypothetical protein